ncbi:MAG: gliding motility-associated C-terminal domain-containing protein [Bacteroidota bacterium]
MKHLLPLPFAVGLLLCALHTAAQTPTIQDCLGAIPICEPIYYEDQVVDGMGNYPNEISNAISCLADERNAIWYTFTVNETGDFGFILTANDPGDDYDWALYDITNAECADIKNDPSLLVSCNAAGQQGSDRTCIGPTGATGDSPHNIQGAGCHTNPPTIRKGLTPLNALVPVQKYNTYVLVVSNWSRSTNGYKIDFGVSAGIGIFDLEDPEVVDASFPEQCGDNRIKIEFNENIQCATVNNFNFVLDGPGAPYDVQVVSPICDNDGLYTRKFELIIDPPITQSGDFQISLDGDRSTEVLDLCNNPAFNTSLDFSVQIDGGIDIDLGDDIAICPGNGVKLDATIDASTSAFDATYLWSTGATTPTINVSEPGDYGVTVTVGCATGSDEVSLIVDSQGGGPYVNLGEDKLLCGRERIELDATNFEADYLWSTGSTNPIISVREAGTYSVTVTDDCGTTIDEITLTYQEEPILDLGENQQICPGDQLTLDATTPNATYLWQDGSTASTFNVRQSGTYTVSVTTVCGTITDEIEFTYVPALSLDLGGDQSLCGTTELTLDATNENATYLWQDGSTDATFTPTTSGTYTVTVTSACESLSESVEITFGEGITFDLGEDQELCDGESITLNPQIDNADLVWQDGSTNPTFEVSESGTYWLEVTTDCDTFRDSVIVIYVTPPTVDLGADRQLCEDEELTLSIEAGDYTIIWQDGSSANDFIVSQSGTYSVELSNQCGTVSDEIEVTFGEGITFDLGEDQELCEGESVTLNPQVDNATLTWQDGSANSTFEVSESGTYWLEATTDCGTFRDSVIINYTTPPTVDLGADRQLCDGEELMLNIEAGNYTITWQDGSSGNDFVVSQSGTYSVELSNQCGTVSDEIEVTFGEGITFNLGADQELCEGETLTLNPQLDIAELVWQDGSTNTTFEVTESGTYWVEATTDCGTFRDSVIVDYLSTPTVNLGSDQTICEGEILTLAVVSDFDLVWSDGTTADSLVINSAGLYSVTASNRCGEATDEITISVTPDFEVNLGADASICEGENLLLMTDLEGVDLRWQDDSQQPNLSVETAGIYWLEAQNSCFTRRDSVEVMLLELPMIDLGADDLICPGETLELSVELGFEADLEWQDGSTSSSFTVTEAGMYQVTARNDCGIAMDQIRFTTPPPIELELGPDTTICEGESYLLSAGRTMDQNYRWQDGSGRNTFIAREPGYYVVQVSNDCETQMDEVFLEACQVCDLYAPNAFSPNVDGQNDRFSVFPNCVFIEYELKIYDRWGTIIFTSNDLENGWDGMIAGQTAPPGVYVWQVNYMVEENYEMKKGIEAGEVTLFR